MKILSMIEVNDLFIKLSKVNFWRHFIPHGNNTVSKILDEMQCHVFKIRPDISLLIFVYNHV